jgi:hypothetical protein
VPATHFSRDFFAGINIQSNQYLDLSEQGFLALHSSVPSRLHDPRVANAQKNLACHFPESPIKPTPWKIHNRR